MNIPRVQLSHTLRFDPARDWTVALVVALVLLLASVGANLWLFHDVVGGGVLGSSVPSAPQVFDQSTLTTIEKVVDDRAAEEQKYQDGAHHFIDPSR